MKRKISWLILSCLMVLSLVLASCAPAVVEKEAADGVVKEVGEEVVVEGVVVEGAVEEAVEEAVVEEGVETVTFTVYKVDGTPVTKTVEKPRYGGRMRYSNLRPVAGFDPRFASDWQSHQMYMTNEVLYAGDWRRAPAGTGEASFTTDARAAEVFRTGILAESWEYQAPDTIIWKLREGIYWWNKAPVNGREFVAKDVVRSYEYVYFEDPAGLTYYAPGTTQYLLSVKALDRYTVELKVLPGFAYSPWSQGGLHPVPYEFAELGTNMLDWKDVVGTGPFLIRDYVAHSSVTLDRNPDYWQKHPLYGDQMPYLDGIDIYIIPDVATRIAALRTGKLDYTDEVPFEEKDALMRAKPELKSAGLIKYAVVYSMFMRQDDPESPFSDIRVRKALNMALDRQEMVDYLFGGNAFYWGWSTVPVADHALIHIPFEDLPADVQEIYTYNPTKAKQLLTEAGYPDGFKTQIWTTAPFVDWLIAVQSYFGDIGVTLDIKPLEQGTWTSMRRTTPHTYEGMFWSWWWIGDTLNMGRINPDSSTNVSNVNVPAYMEARAEILAAWPDEPEMHRLFKEISPEIIGQAYAVNIPPVFEYNMWWPWMRDYQGEWSLGGTASPISFAPYIWYDTELKKSMGY